MKKFISIALIVVGILLISYQLISDYLFKQSHTSEFTEKITEEVTAEQMAENNEKEVENDFEAITHIDSMETYRRIGAEETPEFVVAQLIIPSMKRNLAVSKGINVDNLWVGVATMKTDQALGEGNYAIAGHNHRIEGSLFQGLEYLKAGEDIYITDKVKIYHYRTYDNLVTPPDAFHLIEDGVSEDRGKPVLSLMTCARPIEDDLRIFVQAELVDIKDYDQELFNTLYSGYEQPSK